MAKLDRDWKALTAFYAFPAEQWRHLRTFATVKLGTRVTKGAQGRRQQGRRAGHGLQAAAHRRGALAALQRHDLVADVLNDVTYKDGIRVPDEHPTRDEKFAA